MYYGSCMIIEIDENDVIWEMDGEEYCTNEEALMLLLHDNVLFANSRQYYDKITDKLYPATVLLFVNCNDTFYYASADAESVELSEVKELYKLWLKNKSYGPTIWACLKRNTQPIPQIKKYLIDNDLWSDELENCEKNYYDKKN